MKYCETDPKLVRLVEDEDSTLLISVEETRNGNRKHVLLGLGPDQMISGASLKKTIAAAAAAVDHAFS